MYQPSLSESRNQVVTSQKATTDRLLALPVPQLFTARTVTCPLCVPTVTVTELLLPPAVIVQPVGKVHA